MEARIPRWILDGTPEEMLPYEVVRHLLDTWDDERVLSSPAVTPEQRWLWAIERVEEARLADGLLYVFRTCWPSIILVAIEAAHRIGADDYAETLRAAGDIIFPDGWPTNEEEEISAWERFDAVGGRPEASLIRDLDTSVSRSQLQAARIVSIHSHPAAFFDDGPAPTPQERLRWVECSLDGRNTRSIDIERGIRIVRRVLDEAASAGDDRLAAAARLRLARIEELRDQRDAHQAQLTRRYQR